MNAFEKKIADAAADVRKKGAKGQLFVVPIVYKRCFAPCRAGKCNCFATIDDRFCIVDEDGRKQAMQDANEEIQMYNKELKRLDNGSSTPT